MTGAAPSFRSRFVRAFWAGHNDSPAVRREIARLTEALGSGRGLNVGCGFTRLDARVINLDLAPSGAADVAGDALRLPFTDGAFDLVLSQEMVEHTADPFRAVREMARVLRPGGRLYLQAPFIIGYHPGPEDFWRFTGPGMRRLAEQAGLACERLEQSVSGGTGFYRITVEFFAGMAARLWRGFYLPVKAVCSLACYPLTLLNGWIGRGTQADRIPGGYFVVAVKR